MNKYDIFDAIGGVDDELLMCPEPKTARRLPMRRLLIAAAAVMLMAVTAVATPGIRDWIFAQESTLNQDGVVVMPDENGLGGGYQVASYDVELVLENASNAPLLIEDFRLPTWFEQNGWTAEVFYPFGDPSCSIHAFFHPAEDESVNVSFTQGIFSAESAWDETREARFYVPGTIHGDLVEEPVTIGSWEATLYITPLWFDENVGSDPGRKTIIWSDGEYAYSLVFDYEIEISQIEEVILSLNSVDISSYEYIEIEEQPTTPIETFYSLGMVPDGFELEQRTWRVNNAWETYSLDFYHFITLHQCVNPSEENYGPYMEIEGELLSMQLDQRDFTAEEYLIDDVQITIIREANAGPKLMWYRGDYCFSLSFSFEPGLTDAELLDYYRSVQPMPDYTDHLTE